MASFSGADLGIVKSCKTVPAPLAVQFNAYNGVNGVGRITLGQRGGKTVVTGWVAGVDEADLESIKAGFFALQLQGSASDLIDNKGNLWPNVVLVLFEPDGERIPGVPGGGIAEAYVAEFFHLTF